MNELTNTVLECKNAYDIEFALDLLACGHCTGKHINTFNKDLHTYSITCFEKDYDIVVKEGIPVTIYFK